MCSMLGVLRSRADRYRGKVTDVPDPGYVPIGPPDPPVFPVLGLNS